MEINGISDVSALTQALNLEQNAVEKAANEEDGSKNFAEILGDVVNKANELQEDSNKLTEDFILGKNDNVHEVMIAAQKSEIYLSFLIEIRNRVVDMYREFSRMQA